jgi:hypothetical protein
MQILDPDKNSDRHLKEVFLAGVKEGHKKFPTGSTLGVGLNQFAYAPLSEPLTEAQIVSIKEGKQTLFFLVGGGWRDNRNEFHYWVEGRRAELPLFPSLQNFARKSLWKLNTTKARKL